MNCISSPAMEDWKLISYIDGEADNSVVAHVAECEYCREKADRLQKLQVRMRAQFHRRACPSSMELGEYHLGLLPQQQKLILAQHLRQCPVCRREISQLAEFLREPTPQPDITRSVRVFVAKLISRGGTTQEQTGSAISASFAGLRGEEDEPFIYQSGNAKIVIDVQDDVEQMGNKVLLGLVIGLESKEFVVQISQEGQMIATTSVDKIGNFIISHLVPGNYQVDLKGQDVEIHIKSLSIE